jgi:hypothetical protein
VDAQVNISCKPMLKGGVAKSRTQMRGSLRDSCRDPFWFHDRTSAKDSDRESPLLPQFNYEYNHKLEVRHIELMFYH